MKDSFKSDKYDTPVGLHIVAIGPGRQHTSKPTVHIDAKAKKLFFFHFVGTNLFNREAQANATCRETLLQVGLNLFAYLIH